MIIRYRGIIGSTVYTLCEYNSISPSGVCAMAEKVLESIWLHYDITKVYTTDNILFATDRCTPRPIVKLKTKALMNPRIASHITNLFENNPKIV